MKRCTVDTNVPIVANGRPDPSRGARPPSIECQEAALNQLIEIVESGTAVLDLEGHIQAEYARHLNPSGQPGAGDRFFLRVINSMPGLVERVTLPTRTDGSFVDFPSDLALHAFDRSDRKFAALSRREGIPVLTATDEDWVDHRVALEANGVHIEFVCGCNTANWFAT